MARRGWGVSIVTAVGVAAGAGAAQLGFGYGLGVITWTPTDAGANDTAWADGLAWASWLAASSTVLGAVCAQRLHHRSVPAPATSAEPTPTAEPDRAESTAVEAGRTPPVEGTDKVQGTTAGRSTREADPQRGERDGLLRSLALALAAGLGGLVTVLLVAVPARVAVGADTSVPQRVAALHATLGILIGVLVALWALRSRTAALNVTVTAAWLWLLAVVSVVDGVRVGRGLTGAQLGTWQLDPDHARYWIGGQLYWPGALLALIPALLIGALAARRAARAGGHRVGAAASGAAGPLLVALAYLTTVPRWATLGPAQFSTQLIAPYAVIAGIGGSVLVAVLAERADRRRAASREATTSEPAAVDPAADAGPPPATGTAPGADPRSTSTVGALSAEPSDGLTAAQDATASAPPTSRATRSRSRDAAVPRPRDADASPTRGSAVPPRRDGVPQVPAPRTDPDLSDPADAIGGEPAESPAPSSRRRRPSRPGTD
ncbi:hypothetical protein [Micromonospora profundi]|uniref:Uncharacterized protein n=1 Tax=Micromonospora profundi TaxID=1420889 RepID=A0AAJ6HV08_9ACTN|nr:hypothetical protein [Micromonospora profundi]WLS46942.1 hypothetical protein Q3V37_06715 [Micromonospora profundi]